MILKRKLLCWGFALGILYFSGGCNKRPPKVLDEDKMVDVMVDMQLADAYYNTNSGPKTRMEKDILTASVLKKHGVTQEELDSTIIYYGKNIDDYFRLFAKVEQKLKGQSQGEGKEVQTNENDIWPYGAYTMVMDNQSSDGITFSMPIADVKPGSVLEWKMRFTAPEGIDATLGVEYESGLVTFVKKSTGSDHSLSLQLLTDTAMGIKRAFGVVTVPESSKPLRIDSIRLVKSDYDSLIYNKLRHQKKIFPAAPKPHEEKETTDSLKS